MSIKKTQEQFEKEVYALVNDEYVIEGQYINNKTKIIIRHTVCNHSYTVKPKSFLDGNRCPSCRNKTRGAKAKTTTQFKKELYELTKGEYELIGDYNGVYNKVTLLHNTCGNEWQVTPNAFLSLKTRCNKCVRRLQGLSQRKTQEEFEKDVFDKYKDDYTVLGKYERSNIKIRVKHNKCGTELMVTPYHLLEKPCCSYCNISVGESYIRQFLDSHKISYIEQKKYKDLQYTKKLSYDFHIPSLNGQEYLLEYQGIQHFQPVEIFGGIERYEDQVIRDNLKREYAVRNNITLVEIPYTQKTFKQVSSYLEKELNLWCKAENP